MKISLPSLVLIACVAGHVSAVERPPRAGEVEQQAKKDKPAPKKAPSKRRAVSQVIDSTPRIAAPRPPPLSQPPLFLPPASVPPSPVPIMRCDAGGCVDTSGTRYNGGVGTTLLSPQGKLCNNNGVTVQCF
ncbi:MAG: hypothetical protein V4633_01780 [Pseudomonadota bacterium]